MSEDTCKSHVFYLCFTDKDTTRENYLKHRGPRLSAAIQDTTLELGFMKNTESFLEVIVIHATPSAPFASKHLAKKLHSNKALKEHIAHNKHFSIN